MKKLKIVCGDMTIDKDILTFMAKGQPWFSIHRPRIEWMGSDGMMVTGYFSEGVDRQFQEKWKLKECYFTAPAASLPQSHE